MSATSAAGGRRARLIGWRDVVLLSALTLLPLGLGGRGQVNADTKAYLYLSPFDLLDRARHLWDARVGGGTVTHQAIGYLWPMGPYYALADALGVPDWLAQRLWVGGIQLVAALGALALFRHLLPRSWVQLPAAAAYGLSPYVLGLVTTQSALLLPFAALGWLVLLVVRAMEEPCRWRWPAAFALVVTCCGSLNGSSLFFVVLAAALWVPHAAWGRRRASWRDGVRVLVRAGALTLLTQLWWIAAYVVGGAHGLPLLDLTETVRTTNATSSAAEVLRGLGYWTFYGADSLGPWLAGLAEPYQTSVPLIVVSFAVPLVALAAGALVQWSHRAYFAGLVALGLVISVGAFPVDGPSLLGRLFESLSRRSDAVLSLRNTQRAGPLVALGLAGLAAAGLSALHRRHRRAGLGAGLALGLLVAGALPAQWRTGLVSERFHFSEVPSAWREAAAHLDAGEGRVLAVPGNDFAAHRWGYVGDPVLLGLTDRPVTTRELVPAGSAAAADLLEALDRSMQEGWFEPAALGPAARLLGASQVLVANDQEHERYRVVRPQELWPLVLRAGLTHLAGFGPGYTDRADPRRPRLDEAVLDGLADPEGMPQVAVLDVPSGARPALAAYPISSAVVVDGDGEGVLAAAAAGLLDDPHRLLLLGADLVAGGPDVPAGAAVVLTDSNRKRAHRWYSLRENVGATEPADAAVVTDDPDDARLEIAGPPAPGTQTVVEWDGAARVWASTYGQPASLLPEERPANAFDGDPGTAWRSERTTDGTPRTVGIELLEPSRADHITLVPPRDLLATVATTRARVTLDGHRRFEVEADPATALAAAGIEVALDGEPFTTLEVEVLETSPALGRAGFAEVAIPGVRVQEVVVLPTALAGDLGETLAARPVAIVLSRQRADPADPKRAQPETALDRVVELPVALPVGVDGTARLDPSAPEPVLDALLGAGTEAWPVTTWSSHHLPGSVRSRASAALDGDPGTAWQTPIGDVVGQSLFVELADPVEVASLPVELWLDDRHSTPTGFELRVDGGPPVELLVAPAGPGTGRVDLRLPAPVRGRTFELRITDVQARSTVDWFTGFDFTLPVAIAEVAWPGVPTRPAAADVDTTCRDDLLTVDGTPVPLRITGAAGAAEAGEALLVEACTPPVTLEAGRTRIRTAPGRTTGLALDRLVLQSPTPSEAPPPPPAAATDVDRRPGLVSGTVATDGEPFWLVLDESDNDGWSLVVEGGVAEGPHPVQGGAAGWLVTPDGPGELAVEARWTPQRAVDVALALSAVGVLGCLALLRRPRRRRSEDPARPDGPEPARLAWADGPPPWWVVLGATTAAAALITLPAALGVGTVLLVGRLRPALARLAAPALAGVGVALVVAEQVRRHHPAAFAWPAQFPVAHELVLMAALVALASALAPPDGGVDRQ